MSNHWLELSDAQKVEELHQKLLDLDKKYAKLKLDNEKLEKKIQKIRK